MRVLFSALVAGSLLLAAPASALDALAKMEIAFVGRPSKTVLEPLLYQALSNFGMGVNEANYMTLADILVVLRKDSKKGATELTLLRCLAGMRGSRLRLEDGAAICATLAEQ